jgi:hypothetical protein
MRSADGTTEPQHILRVRVARAEAYWLAGQHSEARREAELAKLGVPSREIAASEAARLGLVSAASA